MSRRSLMTAVAAAGLMITAGAAQAQLRIAVAGPMTGQYAAFGAQMKIGAEKAVADINAAGGIGGQQVVLEVGDDACDPRQAVSVANQFVGRGVKFVAGHFCSGSSIPASKVYTEEGILQISPASTNPAYTDDGSWNTFRVCGRDDQQGEVAGRFIEANYKGKNVAILHDNTAYGKGLADATLNTLQGLKFTHALYSAYTPKEADYSALVSRLKADRIDVIYIGGYHTEAGLIIRQAKEQGMLVTLIGGDALVTQEFWSISGPNGEGSLMTFPADPRKRSTAARLVEQFKAQNVDPEGYVLYTYAAIQVYAEAVSKAGTATDNRRIATVMKANPWPTVLGTITFNGKGDVRDSDYVFYVWRNGSYAELTN